MMLDMRRNQATLYLEARRWTVMPCSWKFFHDVVANIAAGAERKPEP